MTESEASSVVDLAKGLFPVTKQERFDSLGLVFLNFPDADYAKRVLIELSHETDKLDIPAIRNRLQLELHRRGVFADVTMREVREREERRRQEREAAAASQAEVDAFLDGLDAGDLAAFKDATIAAMPEPSRPFFQRLDPAKSVQLRAAMFVHMAGTVAL